MDIMQMKRIIEVRGDSLEVNTKNWFTREMTAGIRAGKERYETGNRIFNMYYVS